MNQSFFINSGMTHTFLSYAVNMPISNQKVLQLIDDLRLGLTEEDALQSQGQAEQLELRMNENVKVCGRIMLHVQCLMDISDDREQYVNFFNSWKQYCA